MTARSGHELSRWGPRASYSDAIDALFETYDEPGHPGCALAVIENGQVTHQRGYGVANVEDDVPILPGTVFRLGSVSKHLCAVCVLALEDRGLLSLDDDVRDHVPEVPDFGTPITLRHLLTMTSGLPDGVVLAIFGGMGGTLELSRERHLALVGRLSRPMFEPGDEFLYSNSNYVLLSLIIERLSGQTLREFMREALFEPLGMASTALVADMTEAVPRKARGYLPGGVGRLRAGLMLYEASGDGGVDTTIEDMVRWFRAYRDDRLPAERCRERMEAGTPLNDGSANPYRLGVSVTRHRGLRKVSHPGGMPGYLADFSYYPDADLGVVVLANWMDPVLLERSDTIADIVLSSHGELPAADPVPELVPAGGLYICHERGCALAIREEHGTPVCYLMGDRSPLRAAGARTFEPAKRGVRYRVEMPSGDDGTLVVRLGAGPALTFVRAKGEPEPPPRPEAFVGRYRSDLLGEVHKIRCADGGLEVVLGSKLRSLSWRTLNYRGGGLFTAPVRGEPTESNLTLKFRRDVAGEVTGFCYSVFRCRDVWFQREEAE